MVGQQRYWACLQRREGARAFASVRVLEERRPRPRQEDRGRRSERVGVMRLLIDGPPRQRRWANRFSSMRRWLPGIVVEVSSDYVDGKKQRMISYTIRRPIAAWVPEGGRG